MTSRAGSERSRAGRPTPTEAARLTRRLRRAAVDTFLEHGYDGTSMEAVAQAADITKSTLYSRYPDKQTLFIAVCSWALTRLERNEQVLEPLPDDLGVALTMIARAILARSVDPDLVRLSRMAIAEAARFPEFAASTQAVTWTPRIQMVMDLLRRQERAGTVAVPDVELAAEQFFAMVGAMPAWLAAYGIHRTPEVEEQHILGAVELFLNGVLVRGDSDAEPSPVETGHRYAPAPTALPRPMEQRRLGRSGLYVSQLALGTGAFDAEDGRGWDERAAAELLDRYLESGGNVLNSSAADGRSEEMCGRVLRGRRADVVLAAKAWLPVGRGPHGGPNSRRYIRASCEATLRRLGTDYIDLYKLHFDDPDTPLEETIGALDDLVRTGKVLYTGASNLPAYRLMKALSVADRLGGARFVAFQGRYDPAVRTVEREHLPLLEEEGLGLMAESPLTGGVQDVRTDEIIKTVRKASLQLGCTPAQLTLAWQLTKPVASVVVDARTVAQLEDGLAALAIEIPPDTAAELDEATRIPAE